VAGVPVAATCIKISAMRQKKRGQLTVSPLRHMMQRSHPAHRMSEAKDQRMMRRERRIPVCISLIDVRSLRKEKLRDAHVPTDSACMQRSGSADSTREKSDEAVAL
jgi:hypothetical protein